LIDGFPGEDIAIGLQNVDDVAAYSRAADFWWINRIRSRNEDLQAEETPEQPSRFEIGGEAPTLLGDNPFVLLRTIQHPRISPEMIHLHSWEIGDVLRTVHEALQTFPDDIRPVRIELYSTMLAGLGIQQHN
jgi:hypothetical protein